MSENIEQQVNELITSRPGAESIQAASSFEQVEAIELYDGIYMSQGTSNAYMLVGESARIIINTGMGFEALTHKKLFDAACHKATSHIVITQGHVDHLGGANQFRDENTLLVAQALNPQCQQDDERIAPLRQSQSYVWFKPVIDQALEVAKDNPEVFLQSKPQADVLFDESYTIDASGEVIEVIALHGGETLDSCMVWLPERKILFSGNAFGPLFPHFPNFNTIRGDKYRYTQDYLRALNKVRELSPEVLITGHGFPVEGKDLITASLNRLERAVNYVHDTTLAAMNKGENIHHIMQCIQLPNNAYVGEGYGRVQWAVKTIWEQYIGWFQLQDTSELLATSARSIYKDLIDLAGVEHITQKAQDYFNNGDIETTIVLCDLMKDQAYTPAIELNISAHEKLLDQEQHNFWFKGWLENQMVQLKLQLHPSTGAVND